MDIKAIFRDLLYAVGLLPAYKIPLRKRGVKGNILINGVSKPIAGFCLSLVGERIKDVAVNQDSFFISFSNNRIALAVADGLGSRKESHIGAEKSVRCAVRILRDGIQGMAADRLKAEMPKAMGDKYSREYDSTMALCCLTNNRLDILRAGDGITAVATASQYEMIEQADKKELNTTETFRRALQKGSLNQRSLELDENGYPWYLLSATDGFSNAFAKDNGVKQYLNQLSTIPAYGFSESALAATMSFIKSWPPHLRQDDITVVVLKVG